MTGKFGAFLRRIKVEKDFRLRPVAEKTGISLTYLSDIFHSRRLPPDREKLELLASALDLTQAERYEMYDAAAMDRKKYRWIWQVILWMNPCRTCGLYSGRQRA